MVSQTVTRIGGAAMLLAALFIIYIGAYDKNLSQFEPLHWDFNWLMAVATIVAGALLIVIPRNKIMVALSGVVWPIVYVASLGVDVVTRLCIGGASANCWPSKSDAFQYLILNNPNIGNGYGWQLWTGTMPTIIFLMAVAFVLSILTLAGLRKSKSLNWEGKNPSPPTTGPSGSPQPPNP